ncbi:MAG: ABC transporter ATP-binding protein [Reichenbachiella sp.]
MDILSTHSLSIGYQSKILLENINLTLEKGRLICLLGQNGVGKSTLLRTLSNIQAPLRGTICIEGNGFKEITRNELARKIGIVTTERIGVSNMSVRNLVALGRFPYTDWWGKEKKEDELAINQAIEICKINYLENSKLGELSDGQYQKAMVARVLAQDTEIILLDEPTAHLDIVNRFEIFKLLAEIKKEKNKAILVSTHELDLSIKYADDLWLMDYNRPIICGSTKEVVESGAIQEIFHTEDNKVDISHLLT